MGEKPTAADEAAAAGIERAAQDAGDAIAIDEEGVQKAAGGGGKGEPAAQSANLNLSKSNIN